MVDTFKVLFKGEFVKFVNYTGNEGNPPPPTPEDRRREEADAYRGDDYYGAEEAYAPMDEKEVESLSQNVPNDDEEPF